MPLHEDSIAAVQSAAPLRQAPAILIEDEGHHGDGRKRHRHQFAQVRSFTRYLAYNLIDVLDAVEKRAHQFLATRRAGIRRTLYASKSGALRDVLQKIINIERAGLIFDDDASGVGIAGPRAKARRCLRCALRRGYHRGIVIRVEKCFRSNAQIPWMVVHQAQRLINGLARLSRALRL